MRPRGRVSNLHGTDRPGSRFRSRRTFLSWWDLHLAAPIKPCHGRAGHVLRSAILNTSSAVCLHWAAAACSACFSVIASVPFVSWPKRSS